MAQSTRDKLIEQLVKIFVEGLTKDTPINLIKSWLKEFDDESALDQLIAIIVQEVIGRIGQGVTKEMKKGHKMSGRRAIEIAEKNLRIMADGFKKQLAEGHQFSDLDGDNEE